MSIASAKWFRGLILASIYSLGILGILGSVGGGGSDDCFPTLSGAAGDDCPRPSYTTSLTHRLSPTPTLIPAPKRFCQGGLSILRSKECVLKPQLNQV